MAELNCDAWIGDLGPNIVLLWTSYLDHMAQLKL